MTLAPLTTGPHVTPANRLAFTTPVREAGGAGHWVTIHGGDEAEPGGGVHIFISSGGVVAKGPHGLLGHHIGAVASHPSVSKAQHHPVGHEPPGARDHPHYAEAPPKPPVAPGEAGSGEVAKRPGKPYARLSGAEQGTKAEQIGKALGEAQGAAKGLKTKGVDRSHLPTLDDKTPGGEPWRDLIGRATKKEERNGVAHYTSANAHYIVKGGHVYEAYGYPGQNLYDDISHPATGDQAERDLKAHQDATVKAAHEAAAAVGGLTDALRAAREKRQGPSFSAPEGAEKMADTAVAHQQAQADLAAHRASADRNPNPWAPHLSPPVGDAKDRELAEKATRAQMAHQAAQAQQQGAQQQQQQEGQRAHEKEMVRLKQAGGGRREAGEQPAKPRPAHEHQPGDSGEVYKARNELQDAQRRWATAKVEARTPAEHKRVDLHQEMVRRLTNQVHDLEGKGKPAQPAQPEQPKKPAQAAYEALQAEVKRRQGGRPVEQTHRGSAAQEVARMEAALPARTRPLAGHEVNSAVQHARRDTVEHGRVLAARLAQTAGTTPNLEVLPHGKVKADTLAEMNTHAGKLPEHYKQLLHAYGAHTFVGGTGSKEGVAPTIAKGQARAYGVFAPELREVHVHPGAVKTGRGVHVLHHELGHATDHALGALRAAQGEPFSQHPGAWLDRLHNPSQTPEALTLHAKHRDNDLLSPNMRQNSDEFFADAFAMHHTQPERLKEAAPDVADYMQRVDKETRERIARARGR